MKENSIVEEEPTDNKPTVIKEERIIVNTEKTMSTNSALKKFLEKASCALLFMLSISISIIIH